MRLERGENIQNLLYKIVVLSTLYFSLRRSPHDILSMSISEKRGVARLTTSQPTSQGTYGVHMAAEG